MMISFQDLRAGANQSKDDTKVIKDQAVTDLFAAELCRVFTIHELAIDHCQQYFRDQDVTSSHTCADITSIWSQIDIKAITIQDVSQLAMAASVFHDDLGKITTQTGPVAINIPIAAIKNFFRSKKKNIFINGSVQDKNSSFLVVAQILQEDSSWAWLLPQDDVKTNDPLQTLPELLRDLSRHLANRIMGHQSQLINVLPGDHFQNYTELLGDFISYLRSVADPHSVASTPKSAKIDQYNKLKTDLDQFIAAEPHDLRTYYLTYIMSLLAIHMNDYREALRYLLYADAIEPFVLTAIVRAGLQPKEVQWSKQIYHGLPLG